MLTVALTLAAVNAMANKQMIAVDLHWLQESGDRDERDRKVLHHIHAPWDICTPAEVQESVEEAQRYVDKNVASGDWIRAVIHEFPMEDITNGT